MIKIENYQIDVVTSIDKIERGVWERILGGAHPAKRYDFLRCIEAAYPERQYRYFMIYPCGEENQKLIGFFFSTQQHHDLKLMLPDKLGYLIDRVRRVWPRFAMLSITMTGCMETHGNHWWLDHRYISDEKLFSLLDVLLKRHHRSLIYIIRDLHEPFAVTTPFKEAANKAGYHSVDGLPLAILPLRDSDPDAHLARLRQNPRKVVRKVLKEFETLNYTLKKTSTFEGIVDEIYPLYLNVHRRAKEFRREIFPKSFFIYLARHCKDMVEVTMLLGEKGNIEAFTLSLFDRGTYNPFLFGKKQSDGRQPNLYYYLMWSDVNSAAEKGIATVDMGVTNYFPKQNIGAQLHSIAMLASFNQRLQYLNRLLPKVISYPQPKARNAYRKDNIKKG